ncbi:hypothetical protein [Aeromonas sp. WP2-W18-CRE-05]|nr:hypothetical protein [Aeromonas sp. WP2-W18-CRE-05]BBQ24762.1 hypothetical protein WP2W18C05_09780 [Aeromonas sp. WP2-W18-CRE-05]
MTEINKSEVVGENAQPEFEQYMHTPTVCSYCSGLIIPDTILGGTVATMT